ncbi:hypothetical protein D0T84_02435 [Dysgonomonas sp. 521]|uniref:hypothetical protein n=1 Tax=Dysgonomonas sp. 521 TaxID=2302932 RepID=UPI0013D1DA6C|nr:hypothetical protein [Dysgonomonas sp. 521]NDV93774.1 hypothetical protein [Dysgonomonas sp. 521]
MVKDIKKRLIKEVVKPFFKENGFGNKGVNFEKDISLFTIEADIQSQKYYKTEGEENFRINCSVVCPAFNEFCGELPIQQSFGGLVISGDNSWITIKADTGYDGLAAWLKPELDKIKELEIRFRNIENIIYALKEECGLQYAFLLLHQSRTDELNEWLRYKKEALAKFRSELAAIETEGAILNQKPDSLDKRLKLDGIAMRRNKIGSKIEAAQNELDLIAKHIER